jgi:hypothetical protein
MMDIMGKKNGDFRSNKDTLGKESKVGVYIPNILK